MKRNSPQRLVLEPLEDRRLLATCNVVRLGDFGAGHTLGSFSRGDLRFCINYANNNPGPDAINLNVTGTIVTNNNELPDLATDITMTGPGADLLAVEGWSPIFRVSSGATVSITGFTITNGSGYAVTGGIRNEGVLTLNDATVSNNLYLDSLGYGGGISNYGTMTISGSTISGNYAYSEFLDAKGGGIYNKGVMTILNSTISGNDIVGGGRGGGIYNAGFIDIRFSTITQNDGDEGGGGIFNQNGASNFTLYNTIVAGNTAGGGDDNLEGNYTGSSNLIGGDPMLGPLQYNGGHTQTHAVLPGSPALDAGDNTGAPEWDQRGPGFPRIVNGTVDIGAFEVQATGAPPTNDFLALLVTADLETDDWRIE